MEGDGDADRDFVAGLTPLAPGEIDANTLSKDQLARLAEHYETALQAVAASNNTLLAKVAARPDLTPELGALMNEWSLVMSSLFQASALEIERITATLN